MTIYQKLHYSGQFSKGQRTKQQILDAAIQVLARQGIKGATHRAIAHQANLQLSLTTYYFKDIRHLTDEAFLISSSRTIAYTKKTWLNIFEMLDALGKTQLKKLSTRKDLAQRLSLQLTEYLMNKITHHADDLAVEQLLYTEIQSSETLKHLAHYHRQKLIEPFTKLCRYFSDGSAHIDAEILLAAFTQLEYKNLGMPLEQINKEYIYQTAHRLIHWLLKVKKPAIAHVD